MGINRRFFLKLGLSTGMVTSRFALSGQHKEETPEEQLESPHVGCLVDTTLCIGCRKCEEACNKSNELPRPNIPFSDRNILRMKRRPSQSAFTVVNEYPGNPSPDQRSIPSTYAKIQCMHCLTPSCVSACLVGAMTKSDDGAVRYNPKICLGCRYCMIACPFEIPAYEFAEPLTPKVRKCQFCADRPGNSGANPACAAACPTEALVFGRRQNLLTLAEDRIAKRPDRYRDTIYGKRESGGTSWLYLMGRPKEEIGLLDMPETAAAEITESIQHGIFKFGIIPLALYGILGGFMWRSQRKQKNDLKEKSSQQSEKMDESGDDK